MKSKIIGQGYNLKENTSLAKELIDLFESKKYDKFTCLVAFASYGGITALSPYILKVKNNNVKIKVILGVDQLCTSKEALEEVLTWGVDAYVYYTLGGNIFHPKVYLFENNDFYTLIVGSNNLTEGGLVKNVECSLLVQDLRGTSVENAFYSYWKDILDGSDKNLYPLTKQLIDQLFADKIIPSERERLIVSCASRDSSVQGQKQNKYSKAEIQRNPEGFIPKRIKRVVKAKINEIDSTTTEIPLEVSEQVLIAEIGGGPRWKQVNFPIAIFEDFFGAKRGDNSYWINILNIAYDGTLGNVEKRQAVSVKSQNYRFEINCEETKGAYPGESNRPIAIFIKIGPDEFLYHVLRHEHFAYDKVKEYLYKESQNNNRELKRAIIHSEALHVVYPELIV